MTDLRDICSKLMQLEGQSTEDSRIASRAWRPVIVSNAGVDSGTLIAVSADPDMISGVGLTVIVDTQAEHIQIEFVTDVSRIVIWKTTIGPDCCSKCSCHASTVESHYNEPGYKEAIAIPFEIPIDEIDIGYNELMVITK